MNDYLTPSEMEQWMNSLGCYIEQAIGGHYRCVKYEGDGAPYGKVIWDDPACEDASDRDTAICVAYNIITEE